jgi:hypothetical protein
VADPASDGAEIVNLFARYCLTLDHHDIEGWVSLFTSDASTSCTDGPSTGTTGCGR